MQFSLPENLILIGMPGAGKSTIGVLLAKACGYTFLDTDIAIQDHHGCLLQDIVDTKGHLYLRQTESEICQSLNPRHTVIATGGSVVYSPSAMSHFAKLGRIVWLKVGFAEIEERVRKFPLRGLAKSKDQSLKDLYDERQPLYERYAQVVLDCGSLSPDEVVESLLSAIR